MVLVMSRLLRRIATQQRGANMMLRNPAWFCAVAVFIIVMSGADPEGNCSKVSSYYDLTLSHQTSDYFNQSSSPAPCLLSRKPTHTSRQNTPLGIMVSFAGRAKSCTQKEMCMCRNQLCTTTGRTILLSPLV